MHLALILDMAAAAMGDRSAVTGPEGTLTFGRLRDLAGALAVTLREHPQAVYLGTNSTALPVVLFASALAGKAFTPLNYRLTDGELRRVAERTAPACAVVSDDGRTRIDGVDGLRFLSTAEVLSTALTQETVVCDYDAERTAVMLFTSGTTGEPKAALLRHRHVSSYVMSTLEFASAAPSEAALVSVPPYHIAGVAAIVSSAYVGRRIVYLENFSARGWLDLVIAERITHAMVVPTMLARILDLIEDEGISVDHLRHLSYGGGRMPVEVVERALRLLPQVGFVNAYGLTETSSTVSVFGPEDHRLAIDSDDPRVRARLGSVGRPHGEIEVSIRDQNGHEVPRGVRGEVWLRGPQVAGEYASGSRMTAEGWFPTHDGGYVDTDGYLFLDGRLDDVIVRGGENISPGEIEDVLRRHPDVADVAVLGEPSVEWGEQILAVVVPSFGVAPDTASLARHVGEHLGSSRVPARFEFRDELPYSETGKLLRRLILSRE